MPVHIGNFRLRVAGDPPRGPEGYQQEYKPVPPPQQAMLRQAVKAVDGAYRGNAGQCDAVFRRIGSGITLRELLNRKDLWISYSPGTDFVGYAEDPDIILSAAAYGHGADVLASVLVHELSHIGGVGADFGTNRRDDHGFADHAAKACTGTLHPVSQIVRSLEVQLDGCSNCDERSAKGPRRRRRQAGPRRR